jgi:Fic-DOC domain mobile mystery protein B
MTVDEDIGEGPPGSTPLTPDDFAGLLPTWLATQRDLNQAEQANIERAVRWAFTGRRPVKGVDDLLTVTFSAELHKRMFGDVWRWAGQHRKVQTNIGVDAHLISPSMKQTFDDARFWTERRTYPVEEIAVRLHHRLVAIHPYPNGNGRQTRMLADVYLDVLGENRLSWGGGGDLIQQTDQRDEYLAALRSADAQDIAPLLQFATG